MEFYFKLNYCHLVLGFSLQSCIRSVVIHSLMLDILTILAKLIAFLREECMPSTLCLIMSFIFYYNPVNLILLCSLY